TLLSVLTAIVIAAIGWTVALGRHPWTAAVGGAAIGGGIAAMHHIGMSAMQVAGTIVWDQSLVGVSVILGVTLGAVALWVDRRWPRNPSSWGGVILALAVCSTHFTGMAAATIYPHQGGATGDNAVDNHTLGIMLAVATQLILTISGIVFMFERQKTAAQLREAQQRAALAGELLRSAEE